MRSQTFEKIKSHKGHILLILITAIIMTALILNPSRYIESVNQGLMIFVSSVLPALFPFFFFTKLLTSAGMADSMSKIFSKPIRKLYNCPPVGSYVFFMSILSGYPVGARLVADLYEHNMITRSDARTISSFASTSGPIFIIGSIGSVIFNSTTVGYIILVSHIIGALLNGLIYRKRGKQEDNSTLSFNNTTAASYDTILMETITNSVISILIVGGYIAIFYLISDISLDIGLIALLEKIIEPVLSLLNISDVSAKGIALSFFEITRGAVEISNSGCSLKHATPIIAAIISFGGLSVAIQSATYLLKAKIKVSFYLLTKLTQSVITYIIAYIITMIIL